MNNHTPGPWHVDGWNLAAVIFEEKPKVYKRICLCDYARQNSNAVLQQDIANAKLIAAAPELLEALQVCFASLSTYGKHPIIEMQVNAAIKKATE